MLAVQCFCTELEGKHLILDRDFFTPDEDGIVEVVIGRCTWRSSLAGSSLAGRISELILGRHENRKH